MLDKINIRKAIDNDFKEIYLLLIEFALFQKTPEKVIITAEEMSEAKNSFQFFVAEDEHKNIAGFASFFFAYFSWTGKTLYLDDLYVKEKYRKQNIGTLLLETVVEHAKKTGCKKVKWQVSKWNETAINFYKKMGAIVDDMEINCDLYLSSRNK